jgi:hypothetical protein
LPKKVATAWHKAEVKYFALIMVLSAEPCSGNGTCQRIFTSGCYSSSLSCIGSNFHLEVAPVHLSDNISRQVFAEPDIKNDSFCIDKGAWDSVQLSEDLYLG